MSFIFRLLFGEPGAGMSEEDRDISDQIRKLKTLKVKDGHISIDPSEVVTEEFERDRSEAGKRYVSR